MNHKTDMREALQLCIDAMLHDGVPTDPYHPRRVALTAAEAALACRHDAELAMIREQAAAETDDWAERQTKEPTKEECDAMFVRKVLALSRPDAQESLAIENVVKDSTPKVSQVLAQADEPTAWRPGSETPPVKEGKAQEFILAVRRKHAPEKVFVFAANYANNFTYDESLSGRDGEDFTAHGWYLCGLDTSGEFDEVYEAITLNEGDEILGWQPLPKWQEVPAAAPAPVSEPSPDREQVGEASLDLAKTFKQWVRDHEAELNSREYSRIDRALDQFIMDLALRNASPSRECGERQGAAQSVSKAVATLHDLDRWLGNSGYDADHPWRLSIARALASAPTFGGNAMPSRDFPLTAAQAVDIWIENSKDPLQFAKAIFRIASVRSIPDAAPAVAQPLTDTLRGYFETIVKYLEADLPGLALNTAEKARALLEGKGE